MKSKLTLGEKLKDLRVAKNLKLADVEDETGISSSTVQRLEADDDIRVGYQDIETLARFYDASADYLFGLTDLVQYRNIEIDELQLPDTAIGVLKDGQLNNRLIGEFLSHSDFPKLLNAMEIYIDQKVQSQISTMNAMYKYTETTIKDNYEVLENDAIMLFLEESVIDEDDYLRYRISERFNALMKSLFDAHKKDKLSPEQADMLADMKEHAEAFIELQKTETADKAKAILLCRDLGLNASKLTDEEWRVLIKVLDTAKPNKRLNQRKKKKR